VPGKENFQTCWNPKEKSSSKDENSIHYEVVWDSSANKTYTMYTLVVIVENAQNFNIFADKWTTSTDGWVETRRWECVLAWSKDTNKDTNTDTQRERERERERGEAAAKGSWECESWVCKLKWGSSIRQCSYIWQ
jgi:hypothetical protein